MGVLNISLVRLYAPYSARMKFVDDDAAKKRKLLPTALPPSSLPFAERKHTALHEAAHAAAARAYGLSIDFAEVGVSPNGTIGRVAHAKGAKGAAWARTVISLAGPSADLVFYNTSDNGARNDLKRAHQYAQEVDPQNSGEVIRQAWTTAEKIVRDNRTVISCLAAILERNGKLSGAEIDGIIGSISFTGKVRPGPLRPRATEGEICELGLVSEIEKQTHRRHCGNCGEKLADPSSEVCPGCGALIVAFDDIRLGEAQ